MEFYLSNEYDQLRERAAAFFAETVTEDFRKRRFEWPFDWEFNKKLARWRQENLSSDDVFQQMAFDEEADRAGIDLTYLHPTMAVERVLAAVGTERQKAEYLPKIRAGEILFSIGYTEPDSGSDVAAAKTRAIRDGDEWIINGQKIFTSHAQFSSYIFLLTRSNIEVPKHEGLSLFIVPREAPGVEVRSIRTLAYHPAAMTFYSDVRVSDANRVGEVDGGWAVLRLALSLERSSSHSFLGNLLNAMSRWIADAEDPSGVPLRNNPMVRERLARMAIDNEVADLLTYRAAWMLSRGEVAGSEVNISKLFGSEAYGRHAAQMMDVIGLASTIQQDDSRAPIGGWADYSIRDAPVRTVGGGSSEIQRDIISQRRLGLPRSRPRN